MNPILNIVTPTLAIEPQIPGSTTANGQSAGDGLFAQIFAVAMSGSPQNVVFPIIGLPAMAQATIEGDVPKVDLTEMVAASSESRVMDAINGQLPSAFTPEPKIDAEILISPQSQITSAVLTSENPPMAADAAIARRPAAGSMIELIESEAPGAHGPNLTVELQSQIGAKLGCLTGQKPNNILVTAQVEISDEVAKVLTAQSADEPPKAAITVEGEDPLASTKPTNKPTTTLKANLRRAFPTMNIESAAAKVNVQVKLSSLQNESQVRAEAPATTLMTVTKTELPIAVAPQMAAAVIVSGRTIKATRVNRESPVATKTSTEDVTKSSVGSEAPVRVESRVAMRKSVQVALKSQGFNIEKLMDSGEIVKDPVVESIAIDKSDFKIATDKQIHEATNRNAEINSVERFKLDIKRGHIDALLKKGEIKLQLQPEHLGGLKIRLITTPTEVNARLETSSEDARRAVEMSLPQLRESFERAGLKLSSIEVLVNNDSNSSRQHAFQQEWRGRNSGARTATNKYDVDAPAATEISHNPLSAYGGVLNLVA